MSEIHRNGIYHRDLILQNVFVANEGSNPQIKIGDFSQAVKGHEYNICCQFVVKMYCVIVPTDPPAGIDRDTACQHDVSDLGVMLMKLTFFKKHHELPAPAKNDILFRTISRDRTVQAELIKVIYYSSIALM